MTPLLIPYQSVPGLSCVALFDSQRMPHSSATITFVLQTQTHAKALEQKIRVLNRIVKGCWSDENTVPPLRVRYSIILIKADLSPLANGAIAMRYHLISFFPCHLYLRAGFVLHVLNLLGELRMQ